MKHIEIAKIMKDRSYLNNEVTLCGWVKTFRNSKTVAFIELNDGSCFQNIQVILDKNISAFADVSYNLGCALKIVGNVVSNINDSNMVEINALSIELLGECPEDYPIQKKKQTVEYLRTMPHLRVRTNMYRALFRVRSKLSIAIHKYFQDENYLYIHTPIITGSDCEGAGEIFQVTTVGYAPNIKNAADYYSSDFFGKKAGLTVSGQLEGEVAACAFGKIYTFGPTFRAENSNTPRHAAEFWQIEPEVAFAELPDIMEIVEDMIKKIIGSVLTECADELQFFEKFFEKGLIEKLHKVVDNNFVIVDYTEAIEILKKADVKFNYPVEWGLDLQTEHERYITEVVYNCPVFVTNYPKHIKSFYMKQNADNKTVAATDLLVPGVGEIIGCSEREADYAKLLAAMEERNMKLEDYHDYMDLRKFGSVPHSGFGLGLERILMYITGVNNIRDMLLYPRTVNSLS